MNHIFWVATSGAFGGLLSWLLGIRAGSSPLVHPFADPFVAVALGVAAALGFVYVVANTARDDLARLIGLSILAGLSWEPALDAGTAVVKGRQEERRVAEATSAVSDAARLSAKVASSPETERLTAALAEKLDEAARHASSVESISALEDLRRAAAPTLQSLPEPAREDPEVRGAAARLNAALSRGVVVRPPREGVGQAAPAAPALDPRVMVLPVD
jgi:hypothetical protein